MKICTKCLQAKLETEFNLCKGKRRAYCKSCHSASVVDWQRRNKEKKKAKQLRYLDKHFPNRPGPTIAAPAEIAKERIRAAKRKWMTANPDLMQSFRKSWNERNKPRILERTHRYQAAKRRAVPGWADNMAMAAVYQEARRLTQITGIKHEVDHIVPLKSDVVCGLHCEANLQILPRSVNRSKANKLICEAIV